MNEEFKLDDRTLKERIHRFIEEEARSCSMEVITPEYVYRMWGGKVELDEIRVVMEDL